MCNHHLTIHSLLVQSENNTGLLLTSSLWRSPASAGGAEALRYKQLLFHHDKASFYGLTYNIDSIEYFDQSGNKKTGVGTWFPFAQFEQLPAFISCWKQNGWTISAELDSVASLSQAFTAQLEEKRFIPARNGRWRWEEPELIRCMLKHAPPFLKQEAEDSAAELITDGATITDTMMTWLQRLLQQSLASGERYHRWVKPYFQLLDEKKDGRLELWKAALLDEKKQHSLSPHLYPFCLKCWNGKTEEPFQLALLLSEPPEERGDWAYELYLKEWKTGHMSTLNSIYRGDHAFVQNPIPHLKKLLSGLLNDYPVNQLQGQQSAGAFTAEEAVTFLLRHAKELERKGMIILVPQHLQEVDAVPKIQGILQQPSGSDGKWNDTVISWNFLIDGMTVDEIQFKQWVEEKRQMIYINNHWVMWNLSLAQQLYHRYEQQQSFQREEFFDIWKKAYFHTENNEFSPVDEQEESGGMIEWSLSPDFYYRMKNIPPQQLPQIWENRLRNYQTEGVRWLLNMRALGFGACLADEMGLGKTIQTIAYLDAYRRQTAGNTAEKKQPFLIVCPTSLLTNWEKEVEKFAPHLLPHVHSGKIQQRRAQLWEMHSKADLVLTTYPLILRDIEEMMRYDWNGLILDEAQKLKNVSSKQRTAISRLRSRHTVALSGTPVENDPKELWSMMDLINPGYLRDEQWFHARFTASQEPEKKQLALKELRALTRPFLLRRTKRQFKNELALRDKIEVQETVPLYKEQRLLYEAVIQELMDHYDELTSREKQAMIFKALTQLKQICNHPAHFLKEAYSSMANRSGKWDACFRLLEKHKRENKQTLVFTQYRFMGELLKREIDRRWEDATPFFHGQLSVAERRQMVADFQEGKTGPFFLVSLRAGGTGLNLTRATEVIHYDRWWNPAVENQATDRVHRIGQTKQVTVTTFLTEGTLEEKIARLMDEKQQLQDELLSSPAAPSLWELSDDELKSLLMLREETGHK
ncbi:Superfamily II DNA or RNA helicase, SNF2 family [Evansella caseinilytica]|uniref:Superfamily II DNA or RNA helicase, SNF2 family n=1 Tax=Evansella caseinilytica TaxID=1503961 RepID=A0A1H3PMM2_9BACI|nr:DEAD/DEAH box helicase [Evansella caseinilytica]SDZ02180.1 Superfamily II DNA or RNA helicase, SNF2 family [Evansella caseinilytica]